MARVINQTVTVNLSVNVRNVRSRQIQKQSQVVIEDDVMFHSITIQDLPTQQQILIEIHVPRYLEVILPLRANAGVQLRVTATYNMFRFSVSMAGKSLVTMVCCPICYMRMVTMSFFFFG